MAPGPRHPDTRSVDEVTQIRSTRARDGARVATVLASLVVAAAVIAMSAGVDHLPGLNGDEAWEAYHIDRLDLRAPPIMTLTGRLLSPSFVAQSWLTQRLLPPGLVTIRLPAVTAGIAGIMLALWLLPKSVPMGAGLGAALLASSLPLHLAYARVSWEVCQIFALSVLAVHAALRKRWVLAWLVFEALLLVHVITLFLAPTLFLGRALDGARRVWRRQFRELREFLPDVGGALLALVLFFQTPLQNGGQPGIADPSSALRYLRGFGELINGASMYEYFSAPLPENLLRICNRLTLLLLLAAMTTILFSRRTPGSAKIFTVGFLSSVALFWMVGGEQPLVPSYSRYSLWMGVPAVIVLAMALQEWQQRLLKVEAPIAAAVLALTFLVMFKSYYFDEMTSRGDVAHPTYWTGQVEPKFAAFDALARSDRVVTTIATDEFWLEWPARYYFKDANSVSVRRIDSTEPFETMRAFFADQGAVVVFARSSIDSRLKDLARAELQRTAFSSYGGRELVVIWRLQ